MKRRTTTSFLNEKMKLDFVFVIICISLLYVGYNAVKSLTWPYDLDQFRDIAQTQTILDDGYGRDPYYLNENTWYNPGLHFIFAAVSLLFNIPVPQVIAQSGPFFIIFAPLAFYYMLKTMFGPWPALIGSAAYLFIPNPYPTWATSLYSPFIFPIIISQAFFYLLIAIFYKTIKKEPSIKQYIFLGILLSFTFLVNTSSAFIGGCMIAFFFLGKMKPGLKNSSRSNYTLTPSLKRFLCFAIPAILISMVFLCFVVFHYRMAIINPMPTNWGWEQLALKGLPQLLKTELFHLPNLIALFGFIHLVIKKQDEEARRIILYWLGIVLAYLAYYLFSILFKNIITLQLIVPVHHFFFYLKALSYVLFGYGAVILMGMLEKKAATHFTFVGKWRQRLTVKYLKPVFYILLAAISVLYIFTLYNRNEYLSASKEASLQRMTDNPAIQSYKWIRKNTKGNDVFLCSNRFSMRVVGPAARKVVATHPYFSNPYVDYETRNIDREKMFEYLETGKFVDFSQLCKKYNVKYVMGSTVVFRKTHPSLQKYLKRVFICGDVVIKKLIL
ncbi:MAG TPA: hypothetical protein VK186_20565 [Candidatus Deferrimicrobium sp.]|nr:hypothetical protein [Candidatus Deferrimicrobium sp.]